MEKKKQAVKRMQSIILAILMTLSILANINLYSINVIEAASYNAKAACDYAQRWTNNSGGNDTGSYNPAYHSYSGNDCANFVTQCLASGGINIPYQVGNGKYDYNTCTRGIYKYLKSCGYQIVRCNTSNCFPGNPVFCVNGDNPDSCSIDHVVICSGYTDGNKSVMCGHTANVRNRINYSRGSNYSYWTALINYSTSGEYYISKNNCTTSHDGSGGGTGSVLKKGSRGSSVSDLQTKLNLVIGAGLAVDGAFGNATYNAVLRFQRTYGLSADGIVGNQTWSRLNAEWQARQVVYPTSVSISASSMNLTVDYTKQLSASINPGNSTNKAITWTSSNGSIATVDSNGKVTGKGKGTVTITASSHNGKTASCNVTVYDPVYVSFVNYDDSELSRVKLEYGGTAKAPENPERKGYKFTGWDGVYQNVTSDATVKALYSKLSYKVDFKETDGTSIVATQNIPFMEAATAPDESALNIPAGYEFSGWSDSFDSIENDITIYPVYKWMDGELPLVVETDENACTANYDEGIYTVRFNLKNHTTSARNARVMIYMMTDGGKLVAQGETRTVKVPAATTDELDENIIQDGLLTIDDLYVVCKSPADKARILVLDDYESAVPLAEITDIPVAAAGYGEWTFEEKASDAPVETRTIYRSKAVNYTTSTTTSSIDGWIKYDQTSVTTRNNDRRSNGSGSSASAPAVAGAYRVWAERESYNYGGNIEPTYTITISSTGGDTYRSMVRWIQNGLNRLGIGTAVDGVYGSNTRAAVMTFQRSYGLSADGQFGPASRAKMKEVIDSRLAYYYYYETQTTTNTYYFYKEAPEWSEWTTDIIEGDSEINPGATKTLVEVATQFRYKENVVETTGTLMTPDCVLPEEASSLAGKEAVVIVFKNKVNQIAEDNVEYIGNTTIGADGSLDISFIPREEISYEGTGDYTIVLGVKGTTNYVKVGTVEAPRPKYNVSFVDMEGKEISAQEIEEGHDAVAPEAPDVEGYTFVGWDTGITNVHDNLTVTAQYEKKNCNITFVDWENQSIDILTIPYGELLVYPDTPVAPEGKEFVGWSVEENTAITEDLVCEAIFKDKELTVTFVDNKGEIVEEVIAVYGTSVLTPPVLTEEEIEEYSIPSIPEKIFSEENQNAEMIFESWGDDIDLSYITTNIVVGAIYKFDSAVVTPVASVETGEYNSTQTVAITSETEGAVIYYTTDGSDPTDITNTNVKIYEQPISISEKTVLKFYAVKMGYNDSEVVEEWYSINTPGNIPVHVVDIRAICDFEYLDVPSGYKDFVEDGTVLKAEDILSDDYETIELSGIYYSIEDMDEWQDNETITESITLYAIYEPRTFAVDYVDEDGNVLASGTASYGSEVDEALVPEKDGFHFSGFTSTDDYSFVTKDITVTVHYVEDSQYANIKFPRTTYSIMEGTTYKLAPKVTYEADGSTATGEVVIYTSSNPEIATVDDVGTVTALKKGEVTITAKVESSGTTAECIMKITGNPDTSIVLYSNSIYRIDSGYLRNITEEKNTVSEIKKQINADKEQLEFTDIDEQKLEESDKAGTGAYVRLLDEDSRVIDSLRIVVLGDYNGDGNISSMDVSGVARSLLGKESPEQVQLVAVDVNGDGNVNNRDAAMIARYLVGKETFGTE